ncbi:MAG: hypothetical protein M3163_10800 [Actinomycetota bacterium]|nr:hypothetical protein [Actinomycetota bacterium]
MNLYTEELVRLRQAELRTEAEANRCCGPSGGARRRRVRGRRSHAGGAQSHPEIGGAGSR